MKKTKIIIYFFAVLLAGTVIFCTADRLPAFFDRMLRETNSAGAADAEETVKIDNLILVNAKNKISAKPAGLVSVYENKTKSYFVRDTQVSVHESAMESLNRMMDDFYKETSLKTVIVTSGYRSIARQEEIYNEKALKFGSAYAKKYVQKPGSSEHHTGLAVDLGLFFEESGASADFDGTGEYAWFYENCHKYGFILRYPQDKEDITGIAYEPWHFRYVGKKHAKYMMKNGLCLEEYIELIGK